MFTTISWNTYLTTITLLSAVYYVFVLLRFYGDDVKQILAGKVSDRAPISPDPFQLSQSLSDEIHAFLHEAGRKGSPKEEVIQSLQTLLGKYPVNDKAFKVSIQNLIERDAKIHCSVQLSEEELVGLWKVSGASL